MAYFFSMGAPLFVFYTLYAFRARVQPNWIAPAVLPLFCLAALYWKDRLGPEARKERHWTRFGYLFGVVAVTFLMAPELVGKVAGAQLPIKLDPLRRVRGWREVVQLVEEKRLQLAAEGREVFVIGDHYGLTGLLSFYQPEAKMAVTSTQPRVYCRWMGIAENQFYFYPNYLERKGQSAIYVLETTKRKTLEPTVASQFGSVTDLGLFDVKRRGRVHQQLQLFECCDLR
jgi:hypothetical protein